MIRTPRSRPPARSRRLVVLAAEGFIVRAAVVRRVRHGLQLEACLHARASNPVEEAGRLLGRLQELCGRLPHRAVVATVEATLARLLLPDGLARRPAPQLQTALGWEMEPRMAYQAGSRRLAAILTGLGILEAARARELLERLQAESPPGSGAPRLRFGELARQLGYVTAEDIRRALALQGWLTPDDGQPICGWTAPPEGVEDAGGWLVAGTGPERREAWRRLLQLHGCSLEGMYPVAGSPLPLLLQEPEGAATFLQLEHGLTVHAHLVNGWPTHLEVQTTEDQPPAPEALGELLAAGEAGDMIRICGPLASRGLAGALEAQCGRPVRMLEGFPEAPAGDDAASSAVVLGCAHHALGLGTPRIPPCVPARDPAAPLWRRPALQAAGSVLLLALAGTALDRWYQERRILAEHEALAAEKRLARMRAEREAREHLATRARKLQEALAEKESERRLLRRRLDYLETELPRRLELLPALLGALAASADGDVCLDAVREIASGRIQVEGRAAGFAAAQRHAGALEHHLRPLGLTLARQDLHGRSAGQGLPTFRFVLAPGEDP